MQIYKNFTSTDMDAVGLRAQIVYWVLGLGREYSNLRTNEWCWMGQA